MEHKKIGYTTGVFDLFHIGHLNILQQSKNNCDYLIVGVSSDELTETYKGRRPVIPFDERVAIVSALRCVDEVVVQDNMDKYEAWKRLRFNVLFHGDDWKTSELYKEIERKLLREGVEVKYFPYTQGVSSSLIKQYLQSPKQS